MTLQTLILEGGNALSDFRIQQLVPRLQAICPNVVGLSGRYLHLVASVTSLEDTAQQTLKQLLTYGDPAPSEANAAASWTLCVSPRLGTVSPWASKATDIAHNCGLSVRRIERLVSYRLKFAADLHVTQLSADVKLALADLLHDRMTESILSMA